MKVMIDYKNLQLKNYFCLLEVKFWAEGQIVTEMNLSNTLNYAAVTFAAEVNLLSTASKKCFHDSKKCNVWTLAGASQNAKVISLSSFELCRNCCGHLFSEEELFKNTFQSPKSFVWLFWFYFILRSPFLLFLFPNVNLPPDGSWVNQSACFMLKSKWHNLKVCVLSPV